MSSLVPRSLTKREVGGWMRAKANLLVEGLLENPQLSERGAKELLS